MIPQELQVAKYLFETARSIFRPDDSIAAGTSISLAQDAIELLAYVITINHGGSASNSPFPTLLNGIERLPKNKNQRSFPLKDRMITLNRIRVDFKHHGALPNCQESQRLLDLAEESLRTGMKEFFDVEYDTLSRADLIANKVIKSHVKQAESYFEQSTIVECMKECAYAYHFVTDIISKQIPEVDHNLRCGDEFFSAAQAFGAPHNPRLFQYIYEYLKLLRDMNISAVLDLKGPATTRFRTLIPHVTQYGNGNLQVHMTKTQYTQAEAAFCIKFVTDVALKAEQWNDRTGLPPGEDPFKYLHA